jgi:hypothetical protein
MGRDAVWSQSVPRLGKNFFVINNIDRASGLINVSYSGDPERYLDCGIVAAQKPFSSYVVEFPASRGAMQYSVLNPLGILVSLDRRMVLEGRVNLVFEEVGKDETLVTASAKYVVTRTVRSTNSPDVHVDTVTFNTAGHGDLSGGDEVVTCYANGVLESELLNALQ